MMAVLGISGSLRAASFNTALVKLAGERLGDFAKFELADLRLPLFDEDLEAQGMPDAVLRLSRQIAEADGVLIATPEYNKNTSGVLKNALDWVSRTRPQPFAKKPVAIMSAAAGRAGGERTQFSLRHCLTPFNPMIVQLPELMVAGPDKAFADGKLVDERASATLDRLLAQFKRMIQAGRALEASAS